MSEPSITNKHGAFKAGDHVSFNVENQYSGAWVGPLDGVLTRENDELQLLCKHNGRACIVTIGKGYDAYEGTIRKYESD